VLSRERSLAPVWNWQLRGVRALPESGHTDPGATT
jgi:hypothetical protein